MGNAESSDEKGSYAAAAKEEPKEPDKVQKAQPSAPPGSAPKGKAGSKDGGGGAFTSMKQSMTKVGQSLGVLEKPRTLEDEFCDMCPKLTLQQKIAGFCACSGLGYLISVMGTLCLAQGYSDQNIQKFATLYIAGNVIALVATALFVGGQKMCHKMAAKTRYIGTIIWLSLMIGVFAAAMMHAPMTVIVPLLIFEILAAGWYSASYVPFGRKMIITCCQASLFSPCPEVLKPIGDQV